MNQNGKVFRILDDSGYTYGYTVYSYIYIHSDKYNIQFNDNIDEYHTQKFLSLKKDNINLSDLYRNRTDHLKLEYFADLETAQHLIRLAAL